MDSRLRYGDLHVGELHVVTLQLVLDVDVTAAARLVRPAVDCKYKTKIRVLKTPTFACISN